MADTNLGRLLRLLGRERAARRATLGGGVEPEEAGEPLVPGTEHATRVAYARDVELRTSRDRSSALVSMSEEALAPLREIGALVERLHLLAADAETRAALAGVRRRAEQASATVQEMLELALLTPGGIPLVREDFDVLASIEGVLERALVEARPRSTSLLPAIDGSVPARLAGDRRKLEHALFTLLASAIATIERGEIGLFVDALPTPLGTRLSFTVEVSGPIAPDTDLFGRAASLTLTRVLVAQLGGTVDVERAPGVAGRVTIELELARSEPESPCEPRSSQDGIDRPDDARPRAEGGRDEGGARAASPLAPRAPQGIR